MSILKIAQIGHPVLIKKAEAIPVEEITTPKIQQLIDNMIDTLHRENGVGLAAPQVHQSKRIIVVERASLKNTRIKVKVPLTIVINPEIVKKSKEKLLDWEGCFSIAHGKIRGTVPRHTRIIVTGYDRNSKKIRFMARSLRARILQHEIDHLDGIFFIERMRVKDLKYLSNVKDFRKYHQPKWTHPRPL